jgi:hypothetical protein
MRAEKMKLEIPGAALIGAIRCAGTGMRTQNEAGRSVASLIV